LGDPLRDLLELRPQPLDLRAEFCDLDLEESLSLRHSTTPASTTRTGVSQTPPSR
jgi:hypothetical protein